MPLLYELVNPSDACTFHAADVETAALTTVILGGGQYSSTYLSGETESGEVGEDIPFFMFGGFEDWWEEKGDGFPIKGSIDRSGQKIIDSLMSVCYGDATSRYLFDLAVNASDDPEKRADFIEKWNDKHRSSMNNIMARAHDIAKDLLGKPSAD